MTDPKRTQPAVESAEQANQKPPGEKQTARPGGFAETLPVASRPVPEGAAASPVAPPVPPPWRDSALLERVGRFELRRLLGSGSGGSVYLAHDPTLQRDVALKIPKLPLTDRKSVERFLREARSASRLRHPNVVTVFESGEAEKHCYLVFEYIPGETLATRLERAAGKGPDREPIDPRQAALWVHDLAEALHYAHEEGIIHRDVKPSNILLEENGRPLLMDFGVARRVGVDNTMTTDGTLLGTLAYMSPEQAEGDRGTVGATSDQYNLGVVLYEMLTCELPFSGSTYAILGQIVSAEPRNPRAINSSVPRDLEAICLKAMSKSPSARYATTGEFAADLQRWLDGQPVQARPIGPLKRFGKWCKRNQTTVMAAAIVVLIAALAAVFFATPPTKQGMLALSLAVPGLSVTLDGKPVPGESLREPLRVPPGKHTIVVLRNGEEVERREIKILPGDHEELRLGQELIALPSPPSKHQPTQLDPLQMKLLEWLRDKNAAVRLNYGGDFESPLGPVTSIPTEPFQIKEIDLSGVPLTKADVDRLQAAGLLRYLRISSTGAMDADLRSLRELTTLEFLFLEQLPLTGEGFEHLQNLTNLKQIGLGGCTRIPPERFAQLAKYRELSALFLSGTQFNNESCRGIRTLPNLLLLDVCSSKVTDDGLQDIAALKTLNDLALNFTRVSDDGVRHLRPLKSLGILRLSHTDITNDALRVLKNFPNLGTLDLEKTAITDDGLQHLAEVPLVSLDLRATAISDDGLVYLYPVKSLRTLLLNGANTTPAGRAALQKALPSCQIDVLTPATTVPMPAPLPLPTAAQIPIAVAAPVAPLSPVSLDRPVLEVTSNVTLDPFKLYGPIVIKASNVTIDGQGLTLVGSSGGRPKEWKGTGITLDKVANVTIKNLNAHGWETGLHARDVAGLTVESCNFSNNFHDPDFGWGENGRRGGIVFERVTKSTLRKNKANNVWDACVLVDSHENTIEDNDFGHTSNTCLKLWTSSRNIVQKNIFSHGIRISPGEVHARDSTSVLIESGSNDNRLIDNNCTNGGDGIFVRVLNGWCSTGNYFEGNDCSYANNNGVECWAPRNVFVKNKANHCSYGFWMGGSDQSQLIGNEASHNGERQGNHNSPHLPENGHAGIVFMFGPSSHSIARGNICRNNNGAGIAVIGDIDTQGKKWNAFHWIIEQNTLENNRWGIYLRFADWLHVGGNRFSKNSVAGLQNDSGVQRLTELKTEVAEDRQPPKCVLKGPASAVVGEEVAFDAGDSRSGAATTLQFTWDFGDKEVATTPQTKHRFNAPGFYRLGVTVHDGALSDLAWRDFYVIDNAPEVGTEGQAANWVIDKENDPTCKVAFRDDEAIKIAGSSSVAAVVDPYHGIRVGLLYPRSHDLGWKLTSEAKIVFWLKTENPNLPGFQDVNPVVTLFAADGSSYKLTPKGDFLSQPPYNEAREGWRYFSIPVAGNQDWVAAGKLPEMVSHLSIGIDSWDNKPMRFWIDGLGTK